MSGRQLNDWLSSYLEYVENTEPPLSFHTWVALSTLSSALQRKVYMVWGHDTIYPNQYIVLIGPSGQTRKGVSIEIARPIMEAVGIHIAAERITREAFLRFMKDSFDNYKDPTTGKIEFQCAITAIAEELSVFLGQKDVGFLAELTSLYNCSKVWTYRTKHQGTDRITGVCLNILAASAPDWLPSILPQEAMGGGWTSRTIFVVEEHKRKVVSDPNLKEIDLALRKALIGDLEQIRSMAGQIHFDDEAKAMYIDWYETEEQKIKDGTPTVMDPRFKGYNGRRATHIKKIAMCMSASRSNDLIITERDYSRAFDVMMAMEKKMTRAFSGIGKARFAEATEAVLDYIMAKGKVYRSDLLRRYFLDIDLFTLENVEKTLSQMKLIKITHAKGEIFYEYIGKQERNDS